MELTAKGFKKYHDSDGYDITKFLNENLDVAENLAYIDLVVSEFPPASLDLVNKRYKRSTDNKVQECSLDDEGNPYWHDVGGTGGGGGGSTIYISTADATLFNKHLTLYRIISGTPMQVKTGTLSATGSCTISNIMDTGDFKIVVDDNLARASFEVTNYSAYYVTLKSEGEWGFAIKKNEPNPEAKFVRLPDTDNYNYENARMNYTTGEFNYGSWEAWAKDFSIPCMVKYTGEKDYELDLDDYTKKKDGTGSDVANINYQGNAMCAIKCLWVKRTEEEINGELCEVTRFSSIARPGYHAYAHTNVNGDIVPRAYYRIYCGYNNGGKIRSLSGYKPTTNIAGGASTERNYCKANNTTNSVWDMLTWSLWSLIRDAAIMISGTTDSQTAFGNGNIYYANDTDGSRMVSGSTDKKGFMWGSNISNQHIANKIFGMECIFSDTWERIVGLINKNGQICVKSTPGTEDGSTATDYNFTGDGYVVVPGTPGGTSGGYVSAGKNTDHGFIPVTASGSATTHYCDGLWFNNAQVNVALVGGYCAYGLLCGVGCVSLYSLASNVYWNVGVSLSCVPMLEAEE